MKRKLSLLEIAERLALPKTTVFYWIRDLPDPEIKYRDSPARARSRAKAARRNVAKHKALRDAAYRLGWDEYPRLSIEPTFTDFVCMYIGGGVQAGSERGLTRKLRSPRHSAGRLLDSPLFTESGDLLVPLPRRPGP